MHKIPRIPSALILSAALLSPPVAFAQDAAKSKAAAPAPAAKADTAKGKELYPQPFYDFMLKQRLAQGQADSPELRAARCGSRTATRRASTSMRRSRAASSRTPSSPPR